ncbi:MAG: hypothetical protein WCI00_06855 [bacterium]
MTHTQTFIGATGRYISNRRVQNSYFEQRKIRFFTPDGRRDPRTNKEIVTKLGSITGIQERRYFRSNISTSNAGFFATQDARRSSGYNPKKTDVFIFAHNFGDNGDFDCVPSHAARIKNILGIENPDIVACDFAIGGIHWKQDLDRLKDYLGVGPNDLVVETNGYDLTGISEKAQSAFSVLDMDKENLHRVIVIHNLYEEFCLASKVKARWGITSPDVLAFDVLFGCPGWLHGASLAELFISSGKAKRVMVIGAEALSRVSDPHDPDSQIYSDGAGATEFFGRVIAVPAKIDGKIFLFASVGAGMGANAMIYSKRYGMLGYMARSDTTPKHLNLLWMGKSYNPDLDGMFLKMSGRSVFGYAKGYVPELVKRLMDSLGIHISQITRIFLHQANETLDETMTDGVFELFYGRKDLSTKPPTAKYTIPKGLVPMTIKIYANNSVATLCILLAEYGLN